MRPALALLLPAALLLASCGGSPPGTPGPPPPPTSILMATTTSTRDSGLLDFLLPLAKKDTGVEVKVIAVGTGQALRIGERGDADILLVHDPEGEEELVLAGNGVERRTFMFNDFLIAGPEADPAGIRGLRDPCEALRRISAAKAPWLSRGDDSGTHRKERRLLEEAGVRATPPWYRETGQGMGATLTMADELTAYTLTDRATLAAHRAAARLAVLVEGDPRLRNPYSVILVNPARHPAVKADAARKIEDWLTGPEGRRAVEEFRVGGRQVFFVLPAER